MPDAMAIPMMALAIPMIVAPTAIITKHLQKRRELEHTERMRALEVGLLLPKDQGFWTRGRLSAGFGLFLPMASLTMAWMFTESHSRVGEFVWPAVSMISLLGVLAGWRLASKLPGPPPISQRFAESLKSHAYDPDEFDVVSRRG